jgi:hypothetical protein
VYNPSTHAKQLANHPVRIRGERVDAAAVTEVNLRRLARLAEYQLVNKEPDGAWKVPSNLVQLLEDRERTHPRQRLHVEPITMLLEDHSAYRGPTWLDDQIATGAPRAPYGFGAEVSRAVALRERTLEAELRPPPAHPVGSAGPPSPTRLELLEDLERRTVGERLAQERGWRFVAAPQRFSGRVFACETAASGRSYACVVDQAARRFVVVSASPATARNLADRAVDIAADAQGRLAVRQQSRSRGG